MALKFIAYSRDDDRIRIFRKFKDFSPFRPIASQVFFETRAFPPTLNHFWHASCLVMRLSGNDIASIVEATNKSCRFMTLAAEQNGRVIHGANDRRTGRDGNAVA